MESRFLYPHSRQFPFDEVCEHIVRELEARNWTVPGITVEFNSYGSYRMVSYLKGDGFELWFCRIQGHLGGTWNNTAAVTEMIIPGKELHVYDDESGPTFYVYVGDDWERDKRTFFNSIKVNSRLHGEPRTYLKYSGECRCLSAGWPNRSHTHRGRRLPLLVPDNDLGREYDPEGDEPTSYRTDEVFAEFTVWLEDNLLRKIMAQPLPASEQRQPRS